MWVLWLLLTVLKWIGIVAFTIILGVLVTCALPGILAEVIIGGTGPKRYGRFIVGVDSNRLGWGVLFTLTEAWGSQGPCKRLKTIGIHIGTVQISWQ